MISADGPAVDGAAPEAWAEPTDVDLERECASALRLTADGLAADADDDDEAVLGDDA